MVFFNKYKSQLEVKKHKYGFRGRFAWDTKETLIHMCGRDRLTKSTHFIPVMFTCSAEDYARIFIDDIVCRHGITLSIISDWGVQFTSRFWRSFQEGLVLR